jgi:cell division protein FtsL
MGFALFSAFVVIALVVGVVALNAFLAQTSFQAAALQTQLSTLSDRYRALTDEAARLSSPSRVASWAGQHHMVVPEEVHILRVAGTGRPGGTASTGVPGARLGGLALAVKPILGESG